MHRLRDLIGIPFIEGGRDPRVGLDCLGLARLAAERLVGADTPDDYVKEASTEDVTKFKQEAFKAWEKIDEPEIGCAVAMSLDPERPDLVQHVAIYIGDGYMIQTLRKIGSHKVHMDNPLIKKKIRGFYKWKK